MLSKENRGLIEMLAVEKGYGAKRLAADFLRKKTASCFCDTRQRLLRNVDATRSEDRKTGSDRRCTARTDENVNRVEDHMTERLIEDRRRFDQSVIDRAVNQ